MLKSYNPALDSGKCHVVEATYMVSDAKIIVRLPVGKGHVGLEALQNSGVLGSDWVCDLYDFGEFIDIKLEGIKRLSYNDDLDSLDVFWIMVRLLTSLATISVIIWSKSRLSR